MKNVQVIDSADNTAYDIFAVTDEEFDFIFPHGHDVAFIDEVVARHSEQKLIDVMSPIWKRRVPKRDAMGIHGLLFYQLEHKKQYYPTRRDEEAVNPGGGPIR